MTNKNRFKKFEGIVAALALRLIASKIGSLNPQVTRVADALTAIAALAGGCSIEDVDPLLLQATQDLLGMLDVLHNLRARDAEAATRLAAAVMERLASIERMRKVRPSGPLPDYYNHREDVCIGLLVIAYCRGGEVVLPESHTRCEVYLLIVGDEGVFSRAVYALGLAAPSKSEAELAA